jgi:FkbM family methyltransferase
MMKTLFRGYIQETCDRVGELIATLKSAQHYRHIYLFGCGNIGALALDFLKRNDISPFAFCTNDAGAIGSVVRGLKVVSFDEMIKDSQKIIILATLTTAYIREMSQQLRRHGFFEYHHSFGFSLYDRFQTDIADFADHYDELESTLGLLGDEMSKRVFCASINSKINGTLIADDSLISNKPIFLDAVLSFGEKEVYFDVGAYIGDNALRFLDIVPNASVLSFEPDPHNYEIAVARTQDKPGIKITPKGCGEYPGRLSFVARNSPNTALLSQAQSRKDEPTFESEIVKLDDYYEYAPTFISMDIEGGELAALKGAEKIIAGLHPKMAIAIYHNAKDFYEIPQYVLGIYPRYQFYCRNSLMGGEGCIAYFVDQEETPYAG